jgi:hypothetical protein
MNGGGERLVGYDNAHAVSAGSFMSMDCCHLN